MILCHCALVFGLFLAGFDGGNGQDFVTTRAPSQQNGACKSEKCQTLANGETYCIEIITIGTKQQVTIKKNTRVIERKLIEGTMDEIYETEFRKHIGQTNTGNTRRESQRCRKYSNGDEVCIYIIEENGKLKVTVRRNGKEVSEQTTTGTVTDVFEKEFTNFEKTLPTVRPDVGEVIRRHNTRCRQYPNGQTWCIIVVEENGTSTVTVTRNDKQVRQTKSTKTLKEIYETEFTAIEKEMPEEESTAVTILRCRKYPTTEICIRMVRQKDKITVTIIRDGKPVEEKTTTGTIEEVFDKEITKYDEQFLTRGKSVRKEHRRCRRYASGEEVCVVIIEENEKLTVTIIRNGKVVSTRTTTGVVTDIFTSEFTKIDQTMPTTKPETEEELTTQRRTTRCRQYPNGDTWCIIIVEEKGVSTVTITKNNKPVRETKTTGTVQEIYEREFTKIEKEMPDKPTAVKVIRCRTYPNGEEICIELVSENEKVTVTIKRNGKKVEEKVTTGTIDEVFDKEIKKYDEILLKKSITTRRQKCRQYPNGETVCIIIVDEDGKLTVTIIRNGKVVSTRTTTGVVTDIFTSEFTKIDQTMTKTDVTTQRRSTRCRRYPDGDTWCILVIYENGEATVTVTKNKVVVRTFKTKGTVKEIYERVFTTIEKELPEGKSTAVMVIRCRTYSNGNEVCMEMVTEENRVTLTVKVNNKVVDQKVTTGTMKEIFTREIVKYDKMFQVTGPSVETQRRRCRKYPNGETWCVQIVEENGSMKVTVLKNGRVVSETTRTGTALEIYTSEFRKIESTITEVRTRLRKTRCRQYPNGDTWCIIVVEDEGFSIVTVTRNGKVIRESKTTGTMKEIYKREFTLIEKELPEESSKALRISRCRAYGANEEVCIEIEVNTKTNILIITVIRNGKTIEKKEATGTVKEAFQREFAKYDELIISAIAKRTAQRCRKYAGGEEVCVEVVEENGSSRVTVRRNGQVVERKVVVATVAQIYKTEFTKYDQMLSRKVVVTLVGEPSTSRQASSRRCRGYPTGDKVCVEVTTEEYGVLSVVVKRNGKVEIRKSANGTPQQVYDAEFKKYDKRFLLKQE